LLSNSAEDLEEAGEYFYSNKSAKNLPTKTKKTKKKTKKAKMKEKNT